MKKKSSESVCVSRKIVMPDMINPHGTLFGGVIMTWIDKIAYMCAQNFSECSTVVTANIDQIKFIKPAFMGDQVILQAKVVAAGKSSMEIDVTLYREIPGEKIKELIVETSLTFVSFKKNGVKHLVPELVLESDRDFMDFKNAQCRIINRKALRKSVEGNKSHAHLPPSIKQRSKTGLLVRLKEKLRGQLAFLKD